MNRITKWRVKRKINRLSAELTKITNEILEVKERTKIVSATNKTLSWSEYIALRDMHMDRVISDILRKEGK
jgi:hypothetical protein